ncbi:ankyrin repeat-containing protein NPR4-like [Pistacia vera]|uniref:ankyrin repeat-containing protein NPR4-like n=1 Tax=Pistacia vera TaxID=55513 RepID=UPI001263A5EE|nr:ankyrin repeat-containing protein NPR4-like [Pistacia vera]
MLLLETKPWIATMLNYENESAFFIACRQGHLDVVKLMMNQSWLMDFEEDGIDLNALHVAPAMGHTDTVQNILEVRPNFARKSNKNGYSPLHSIHGKVPILEEFMLSSPTSFQYLTKEGETMCHLAVKFNQNDALLAMYIVNTTKEIINCCNNKGHTVLEILELSPGNAESKQLKKAVEAAADKSTELLPLLAGAQETNSQQQTLENSKDILETKSRSLLQYLIDIRKVVSCP